MQADGGGVEVLHADGDCVHLRLIGACRFCPSQQLTIEQTLRPTLEKIVGPGVQLIFS